MEIHVDDRERAVITHIEGVKSETIKYQVKRLTVGDYAIIYRNYIMIIIERKTWADLAASMRDGRKANINKMISARDRSGCQLMYLIEGDPCPKHTKKYCRMPVKNLRAHLDHIAFRDGIHLMHTLNEKGTAERLFELARNITTIKPSMLTEIDHIIDEKKSKNNADAEPNTSCNNADAEPNTSCNNADAEPNTSCNNADAEPNVDQSTILTEKQLSTVSTQEQLLMCLPSIGSVISTVMAESGITLIKLYNDLTYEEVARLKYPTGNSVGLVKAKKICGNRNHMNSESISSKKIQVRILSAIPLISKKTAVTILETFTFKSIMEGNVDITRLKYITRGKSKLGPKAATNILTNLLNKTIS
jgi:ERCC4-type nuclease